jgi:hypothetical protein
MSSSQVGSSGSSSSLRFVGGLSALGCSLLLIGFGCNEQAVGAPVTNVEPQTELPTGPPQDLMAMDEAAEPAAMETPDEPPATSDEGGPIPDGVTGVEDPMEGGDEGMPGDPPLGDPPLNMGPVTFGPNVKVGEGNGVEVTMAAGADGLVFVGWVSGRNCAYSVSTDGGVTWGETLRVATQATDASAFAGDTAVAVDDAGNLYAGCQDYASGGLGTNYVLLGHSRDKGQTWSDFVRVNTSLDKPWLGATGNGTVLLTWLGRPGGMKRSTDYGATWEDTISLGFINHGTTASFAPETSLVHVAYNTGEDTVTYRRSRDLGLSFEQARNLADQGNSCYAPCSPRSHPIVGADADPTGRVVAITWASRLDHPEAEGDDDVWAIVSYDSGDTFSSPIRVNDNLNPSRQFQPWAAVDRYGGVHVAWTDLRDGGQNATYYARMTDLAAGFEPNVQVTDATGNPPNFLGDYKGIDIQGRDVVAVWADTRGSGAGRGIYFARAADAAAAGGPLAP